MKDTFKVRITRENQTWPMGSEHHVRSEGKIYWEIIEGHWKGHWIDKHICEPVEDTMDTFKIGDRVNARKGWEDMRGYGTGTIVSLSLGYDWQVKLDKGDIWCYNNSDLTLMKDTPETYKDYHLLRPITVKELILAGARDEDIEAIERMEYLDEDDKEAVYLILDPIPLTVAIDYASSCIEKLQWLVDKGFVEKVEEREEKKVEMNMLEIRDGGPLNGKGFWLKRQYAPWTIKEDSTGLTCLVPTLKE